jgi:hypothetical protein
MTGKPMKPDKEIELLPDAWERFERAITVIGKAKPIHRSSAKKAAPRARKRRAKA